MPDIELLPVWYSQARRRRKLLRIQCAATAAVLSVLAVVGFARRHAVWETQNQAVALEGRLELSRQHVRELQEARTELTRLRARQQIYQHLGPQVDPNRILASISQCMPRDVGLTMFEISVEDQPMAVSATERVTDRRLKIHLSGVAPTDGEVGQLIEKLDGVPVFTNVQLAYVKGKSDVCREFDLSFTLSLARVPALSGGVADGSGEEGGGR